MRLPVPSKLSLNERQKKLLDAATMLARSERLPQQAAEPNTIYLYDVIDSWGAASAANVAKALDSADGEDIVVRVNSPGGDVFEGRAIATLLREYAGGVEIHVDGVAASAASTIAISGDKTIMARGAMMMIHQAWALTAGNADDLVQLAAVLTQIDADLAADYAAKSGGDAKDMLDLMRSETWLNADAAIEAGLADEVSDPERGKKQPPATGDKADQAAALMARFRLDALPGMPAELAQRIDAARAEAKPKPRRESALKPVEQGAPVVIHAEDSFDAWREQEERKLRLPPPYAA